MYKKLQLGMDAKLFQNKKIIVELDVSVICDLHKLTDCGCSGAPDWIIEIVSPRIPAVTIF